MQGQESSSALDIHASELRALSVSYFDSGDSTEYQAKYIGILFADPQESYVGISTEQRLGVLQRSLEELLEKSEFQYANFLIEASVSELMYSFNEPEAALGFAEPFYGEWLEPLVGATASAYAWIDCINAMRLGGELGRAETLALRLDRVLKGLIEQESAPSERRDGLLTARLFSALADHQVQMALGLPDFSRDRLREAQGCLDELSESFAAIDRAIFAANIKEEECNLWALADRHERRARVAGEAFEILSQASLGTEEEVRANAALPESPYAGLLEAVRVRLTMHQAVGGLVNAIGREGGGEGGVDTAVDSALEEMRALSQRPGLGVSSALRIWARIGREELRLGRLDEAKAASERASELLAGMGGQASASPIARLGVETLQARIGEALGADESERLQQLASLKLGLDGIMGEWDQSELREGGLGFLDFALRREVVVASVGLTAEFEGPEAAIDLLMDVQRRGMLDRTLGLGAPSLDQIRSSLCSHGAGALCFVPGLDELLIVAVDSQEARVLRRPLSRNDLSRIERLRDDLVQPGLGSRFTEDARVLGDLLLGGDLIEIMQPWSSVHIVGQDLLRGVPFEVLSLNGSAFGLEQPISYLPSLPVGVFLGDKWRSTGWSPPEFIFGELDGRSVGLSDARLSVEQDRALTASLPIDARLSPIAADTVDRLQSGWLRGVGMATVFAHGKLDLRKARPSGLWLGPEPEQVLWCADVSAMGAAQVMILSACGAARTNARLGDGGVGSLGGALLEAGSLSIVLAAADVPRDSTVLLTAALQRGIAEGLTISEALLQARREVVDKGAFEDPYHWANFQVFGIGDRALSPRPVRDTPAGGWSPQALVALLAVPLVLLLLLKRRAAPEESPE